MNKLIVKLTKINTVLLSNPKTKTKNLKKNQRKTILSKSLSAEVKFSKNKWKVQIIYKKLKVSKK